MGTTSPIHLRLYRMFTIAPGRDHNHFELIVFQLTH
jgi:hypothetical protein